LDLGQGQLVIDWGEIQRRIPTIDWQQIEQLIPSLRDNPQANQPLTPERQSALDAAIHAQVTLDGRTNFLTGEALDCSKSITPIGPLAIAELANYCGTSSAGGGGPGVGPMADWKPFVLWLGAIALLWFVLTAAAESGLQKEAYAFAGLILAGAVLFMGPDAIKHAQQLAPT
jgi:hypothetical protein